MRRVLKPAGRLLFVEHGLSPDDGVRRWQERLTPLWKRIGGGCHLSRGIAGLIEAAGYRVEWLETGYPAPRQAGPDTGPEADGPVRLSPTALVIQVLTMTVNAD